MISKCKCIANTPALEYQEQKYGAGMRVHQPTPNKPEQGKRTYRCTGCGVERTLKDEDTRFVGGKGKSAHVTRRHGHNPPVRPKKGHQWVLRTTG